MQDETGSSRSIPIVNDVFSPAERKEDLSVRQAEAPA
jgi:hypothetical protein